MGTPLNRYFPYFSREDTFTSARAATTSLQHQVVVSLALHSSLFSSSMLLIFAYL